MTSRSQGYGQKFYDVFTHPAKMEHMFHRIYNQGKIDENQRELFYGMLKHYAKKNENKPNVTYKNSKHFIYQNFNSLWEYYLKKVSDGEIQPETGEVIKQPKRQENFSTQRRETTRNKTNFVQEKDEIENLNGSSDSSDNEIIPIPSPNRSSRKKSKRRKEKYTDADRHNFLKNKTEYNYLGEPPGKIDYKKKRVPYNYNYELPSQDENITFTGKIFNKVTDRGTVKWDNTGVVQNATKIMAANMEKTNQGTTELYIGAPLQGSGEDNQMTSNDPNDPNISITNIPKEVDEKIQELVISFDSRLRNVFVSPRSTSYRFGLRQNLNNNRGWIRGLENGLNNVIKIQLMSVTVPNILRNTTSQFYEPYLYIDFEEINGNLRTPLDDPSRVFSKIDYVDNDVIQNTTHMTLNPVNCCKEYPKNNPLNNLNKFTVNFYNFDGELFDFGEDAPRLINVTLGNPTEFQTQFQHGIDNGERVYITGYESGTQIDNTINRTKGFIVTVNSDDTFEIPVDTTGTTPPTALGNAIIAKFQNNYTVKFTLYGTELQD